MQISVLRKFMHRIKTRMNRRAKRRSEEISELREAPDMPEEEIEITEPSQECDTAPVNDGAESDGTEESGTSEAEQTDGLKMNNKAHLSSSVPRVAKAPLGSISKSEMAEIRSIFGDMDDVEIHRLYKKVTK